MELSKRMAFPGSSVFIHAFMDGRDTPPQNGVEYIRQIEEKCQQYNIKPVASVVGRYYAMDRDNRWDRVEQAYRLLVHGEGKTFSSATEALQHYYKHASEPSRSGDEFVVPSVIVVDGGKPATIRDGDSVIFFNYRGDRPRELTKAFTFDEFPFAHPEKPGETLGFDRGKKLDLFYVAMTEYEKGLPVHVAFSKPPKIKNILGSYLADLGLQQFRCAETEKYPHVTFFFNDYRDEPFAGEGRTMAPSPRDVTTYDQKPQMSAHEITEAVLQRLASQDDDVMIINFANGDMVGHTGNVQAAIVAVETVDECVGRITDAVLKKGGELIITADHGNCEQMIHPETGGPHTAHTTYDVELIVVDDRYKGKTLHTGGRLADIAPTMLAMLGLPQPPEMTGTSLIS